ncbi:MAG: outer membrane protein assembly factor BamD [Verrucomicrobiota bacterium]|nr:outer membrane protein assembly factor BamD [Verrucomicrobiota bacterium]
MRLRFTVPISLLVASIALPSITPAAVVFRPKSKYVAPGDEEVSGTAQELFNRGQAAENAGDRRGAIKAYRTITRKYPKDALAPGAAYRLAVLLEKSGDYVRAADAYRTLVERYPRSPNFDDSIEAQFRIGEMYLQGKKVKLFGIPVKGSMDRAVQIFAGIVRSAPYGKYTARAQFGIGRAAEKQGDANAAVAAYQAVVEKFPDDPIAADAQYQIGYIWYNAGRSGIHDAKAATNAKVGFEDFLYRYPKSEKAAQARENLRQLGQKQTANSYQIAKFYDKQKNYRAAVIYYNDVIRLQPGSAESVQAQRRVAQLRAKVGEDQLQSAALTAATAKKPVKPMPTASSGRGNSGGSSSGVGMRTSPQDVAPLPPADLDESLPPPASFDPDTTAAPDATPSPTP